MHYIIVGSTHGAVFVCVSMCSRLCGTTICWCLQGRKKKQCREKGGQGKKLYVGVPCSICHPGRGLWWHLVHLRNRLLEMQESIEQTEAGLWRWSEREREGRAATRAAFISFAPLTWLLYCVLVHLYRRDWQWTLLPYDMRHSEWH